VGTTEVALAAWRVTRQTTGEVTAEPLEHWPAGVRVLGGTVREGTAYVLLESLKALDQPAGLRAAWIDAWANSSPYDASPMALGNVKDVAELEQRIKAPPHPPSEQTALALLAALRTASSSATALAHSLAAAGVDVGVAWQSLFVQVTGHLDADAVATSALTDRVLSTMRSALSTQACGVDACEAWTDHGHAVVRFTSEDGRWALKTVVEDVAAAAPREVVPRRIVDRSPEPVATRSLLIARARNVAKVLGEASLTGAGGTIGVGLADLAPDAPIVVVSEANTARLFPLHVGSVRAAARDAAWEAAFADVDGDGRTDVVLKMSGHRADNSELSWSQAFLAPPPSVQPTSLEADLPSALTAMDAPDANAAARAAMALPTRSVLRDDACRILASASTPAGFRRVASADARLLLFQEPGMPTWHPRVVPASRVAADEVSGLTSHCSELTCSTTRPYCAWVAGADSLHAWFGWRDERLQLVGAADYDGE
jgi:hypothetical protein